MSISFRTVGNIKVRLWEAGEGPPLLYLHGFEGHPGDAPFLVRLTERHRVIAPETPGYGESSGLDELDGILGLTLFHRQLVEALGLGAVDVVGHSLGGMFAAEFAAICPHRTRRLVLVDAYGLWLDDLPLPDPFVLSEKQFNATKWADAESAPTLTSIFVADPDNPSAAVLERAKNLAAATKFMWPIPDRGLRARLPLLQAPTLIVHGECDTLVPPRYADEFARLIPEARVIQIAGAGHLPMVEREDDFMTAVEAFLAE